MEQCIISAEALLKAAKNLAAHAQQIKGKWGAKGVLQGILVELDNGRLTLTACDGYRLAKMDLSEARILGDFPNVATIFPPTFKGRLQCQASDLLSAAKAMPVSKANPAINLRINGSVRVEANHATVTVPATVEHAQDSVDEEVLTVNRDYLVDALRAVENRAQELLMEWNTSTTAIQIQPANDLPSTTCLLMPIRA